MELNLINDEGKATAKVSASDATFGREFNEALVHQLVTAYLANGGTLEHVKVSSSGMSYRQQLTYIGGEPAILVAAEAKKDEPLRVHETTDLRTETDPSNVMFHHIVVRRLQMILQTACVGPADGRAKFLEQVKANRVALGLP